MSFAEDYEDGSQEFAAESILGVQADLWSCGFSGNDEVADTYCMDFSDANRRRHSNSRVGDKKSDILGMTASPSSSAGSSPTGRVRCRV